PDFNSEFGHLEGDTIVGIHHKSAVVTLDLGIDV
ncbi:transposase, partial [Enterococcus durans IPLA 655]